MLMVRMQHTFYSKQYLKEGMGSQQHQEHQQLIKYFILCFLNKYLFIYFCRILILDEMDQLESKSQEILYSIFEWPSLPKSKLVLIGK